MNRPDETLLSIKLHMRDLTCFCVKGVQPVRDVGNLMGCGCRLRRRLACRHSEILRPTTNFGWDCGSLTGTLEYLQVATPTLRHIEPGRRGTASLAPCSIEVAA